MSTDSDPIAGVSTEDEYLDLLQLKLRDTYRKAVSLGSIQFNMGTLDLLESIEARVYELLDFQESSITPENYRKLSKELEKKRRIEQKQQQENDREKQQRDRNEGHMGLSAFVSDWLASSVLSNFRFRTCSIIIDQSS